MKERKQNPALLIATLGVYLGLVLAGAAPSVLANAALSKQFNVRDEIEFVDEFDNKPDDERSSVNDSLKIYLEDVESFLLTLDRLRSGGKFDLSRDTFDVAQNAIIPCIDANLAGTYTPIRFAVSSEPVKPSLTSLASGMVYGYSLGDCVTLLHSDARGAVESEFDLHFDGSAFWSNVLIKKSSPGRAAELIQQLNAMLDLYAKASPSPVRNSIIQHTTFRSTGDRVIIVTRLPRGSLDSNFAK